MLSQWLAKGVQMTMITLFAFLLIYTLLKIKKSDRNVFDNSFSLSAYSARRRDKRTVNSKKATENCMTS